MPNLGFGPMPLPERLEFIKALLDGPTPHDTHPVDFQGKRQYLPIYRVPLGLPVYRLANGRTLAAQKEYVATNGKPDDFFTVDPDSAEALAAQHEVLLGMKDDKGLFAHLKDNPQKIPLVLTREGYIVNGNRRTCCFRTLVEMDPERYHHFTTVEVVFLPHCTPKDIDELEAQEQIVPEVKADYPWITEAMLLRERQQLHHLSLKEVARFYNMKPAVAREKMQMLDAADRYLDSRGKSRMYSRLAKSEYAFKTLVSLRGKLNDPAKEDIFTEMVFKMIDDEESNGDRVYARIKQLFKNLDKAIASLREVAAQNPSSQEGEPDSQSEPKTSPGTDGVAETLSLFGANGGEDTSINDIVRHVTNPDNHEAVVEVIKDAVEEQAQREKQDQVQNSFMERLQQAYTSLEGAMTELNPESNLTGADGYLTNIEATVARIRAKMAEYAES